MDVKGLISKHKNNIYCSYCYYMFNEYKLLKTKDEKKIRMCVKHI